jgi:hypothetical protein
MSGRLTGVRAAALLMFAPQPSKPKSIDWSNLQRDWSTLRTAHSHITNSSIKRVSYPALVGLLRFSCHRFVLPLGET